MGAFSLPTGDQGIFRQPATGPSQRDPQALRNPFLDEIDRAATDAHAKLSPGAQEALRRAGAPLPQAQAGAPSLITSPKAAPPPMNLGGQRPMSEQPPSGTPDVISAIPSGGIHAPAAKPPVPLSPEGQAQSKYLANITAPPPSDPAQIHTHANTGASGIQQIHSPWARIPLQIAEAIGSGFAPGLTAAIPGTQLHHNMLVGGTENALKQQETLRKGEEDAGTAAATQGHLESETNLQNATAADIEREGKLPSSRQYVKVGKDGLYDAQHKVWVREPSDSAEGGTVHEADDGTFVVIHPNGSASHAKFSDTGEVVKGAPKATSEGELPLGERVGQLNQALTSRYQVLHPKASLPAQYQIPPNATQKDYDRIDKALEAEERAIGTREQQSQTNEMRRQTMALAAGNQQNRQDAAVRGAAFKAYTPALDSAERFNVMSKNYEDAVKNHDQQAMLSLLANHIGMTMGLQKGARLTKDIIHEAEVSRPWLQGLQAKFDKDGYLSGVNLTVPQMQQMVNLGRERFSEDVSKASSEARYQGATDQGPDRVPNRSTINHYIALANGDSAKAKQLAAADGWTVK